MVRERGNLSTEDVIVIGVFLLQPANIFLNQNYFQLLKTQSNIVNAILFGLFQEIFAAYDLGTLHKSWAAISTSPRFFLDHKFNRQKRKQSIKTNICNMKKI
jgi:hypothetical protein